MKNKILYLLLFICGLLSAQTTPTLQRVVNAGNTAFKPIFYNANYGAQYTNRALVDKRYVDSLGTVIAGSAIPGGSNTQLQYNNAGAFGGITGATTNGTVLTLTAAILGTPASATLTNATGLPLTTGVTGILPLANGGTNNTVGASTLSATTNDVTTNSTMYPIWTTGTSGNLPINVSNTLTTFNPSTSQYTFGTSTTTQTLCDWTGTGCATQTFTINHLKSQNSGSIYNFQNSNTGTTAYVGLQLTSGNFATGEYGNIILIPRTATGLGSRTSLFHIGAGSGTADGMELAIDRGSIAMGIVNNGAAGYKALVMDSIEKIGIGTRTPSASLHIAKVGTTTVPPFKISTQGTSFLSSPQAGAIEYGTPGFVIQNDAVLLGGTSLITAEKLSIQSSANTTVYSMIRSSSSGTGAASLYRSQNNSNKVHDFGILSSGYTTAGGFTQAFAYEYSDASGINIMNDNATGSINFYTGGTASGNKFLTVNSTGQLYGTALHNNSGSVTGTVNQMICSGTYTPTLTNTTNIAASTAYQAQWIRVGNVVTVSGNVDIDIISTLSACDMGVSLPIASNIVLATNCAGTCNGANQDQTHNVAVLGDATNDRARFYWVGQSSTTYDGYYYTFTYLIQ